MSKKKKKHPGKKKTLARTKKNKWTERPIDLSRKVVLPSWVPFFNVAWKIALIVFIVFIIVKIRIFGEDKQKNIERASYVEKLPLLDLAEWEYRFLGGHKLIIFADGKVRDTSIDSLHKELKFYWWEVAIKIIDPDQFTGEDAKIAIEIPHIYFEPAGVGDLNLRGEFLRSVGGKIKMTNKKGFEIEVELIEDRGDELVLLFGLNSDKGL